MGCATKHRHNAQKGSVILGLKLAPASHAIAAAAGFNSREGVLIQEVTPGSAAERAGKLSELLLRFAPRGIGTGRDVRDTKASRPRT